VQQAAVRLVGPAPQAVVLVRQVGEREVLPVQRAAVRLVGPAAPAVVPVPRVGKREVHLLRRAALVRAPEVSKERGWAASAARSQVSIQVPPPARG
jgi:hypothetical protein